jgi:hypothetical protein
MKHELRRRTVSASQTKAAQETAVGEGLAVGCLASGIVELTASKMILESAFVSAWRAWSFAAEFPKVQATRQRNDLLPIVRASSRRRSPVVAEWSYRGRLIPYLTNDYELSEAVELLEELTSISLEGWVELADIFARRSSSTTT